MHERIRFFFRKKTTTCLTDLLVTRRWNCNSKIPSSDPLFLASIRSIRLEIRNSTLSRSVNRCQPASLLPVWIHNICLRYYWFHTHLRTPQAASFKHNRVSINRVTFHPFSAGSISNTCGETSKASATGF